MAMLYTYRYWLFFGLFGAHIAIFWPGYLNPDSIGQYQQALNGVYDDHHPAMMSFVWGYLAKIHPGSGMMHVLQISLLYTGFYFIWRGACVFIDFKKSPWALLLIFLIPWLPQMVLYSVTVQKDNAFAFSFLAIGGVLAYFTATGKKMGGVCVFFLTILMMYGISVKYQAQFCAPVFMIWMGFLWTKSKPIWTRVLTTCVIGAAIYGAVGFINHKLVPETKKSHAWQYVKLFDLAAISRKINHDLIPEDNKTPSYTFDKLRDRFQENAVDPYIYTADNIVKKTTDPFKMDLLVRAWESAIWDHPILYLKHRMTNLAYCLGGRVGFSHYDAVMGAVVDPASSVYPILKSALGVIGYLVLSQLPIILLGIAYFVAAIVYWRQSVCARVMLGFTSISFIMLGIFFFMSMAGTPRYTYVSLVMIHACHVFALGLYRERQSVRSVQPQN